MALDPLKHTQFSSAKRKSRQVRNSTIYMPNSRNGAYLNSATQSYSRSRGNTKRKYSSGRTGSGASQIMASLPDLRHYLPIVGIVVAALLLILLVTTLIRSCAPKPEALETQTSLTKVFARTAGTSPQVTNGRRKVGSLQTRAHTLVNYDGLVAQLARETKSATERAGVDSSCVYASLALSIRSPEAANFVVGLSEPDHETIGFGGSVPSGTVPALYQWDERWGYVDYCGLPIGFSGCGVTTMAMARMGITGKTDMSPADMATLSVEQNEADAGTNSSFFTNEAVAEITGVRGTRSDYVSSDILASYLSNSGTYVAMHMKQNTLAGGGHWVLAVGVEDDGSIRINDPNSPTNTTKSWDAEELIGYCDALIALSAA